MCVPISHRALIRRRLRSNLAWNESERVAPIAVAVASVDRQRAGGTPFSKYRSRLQVRGDRLVQKLFQNRAERGGIVFELDQQFQGKLALLSTRPFAQQWVLVFRSAQLKYGIERKEKSKKIRLQSDDSVATKIISPNFSHSHPELESDGNASSPKPEFPVTLVGH